MGGSLTRRILDWLSPARVLVMVTFVFAVALIVVIGVLYSYFVSFGSLPLSKDQATWGQFGDYLGGALNPLISLFALFALLWTIVLQSKELHETKNELIRTANAQEQSMQAMRESVTIARDTAYRQLRAYVCEQVDISNLHQGADHISAPVTIRNFGVTPAYDVRFWAQLRLMTNHEAATFLFEPPADAAAQPPMVVNPEGTYTGGAFIATTPEDRQNANKSLYLWGEITYRDAFGQRHMAKFRFVHMNRYGTQIWQYCAQGNESD